MVVNIKCSVCGKIHKGHTKTMKNVKQIINFYRENVFMCSDCIKSTAKSKKWYESKLFKNRKTI